MSESRKTGTDQGVLGCLAPAKASIMVIGGARVIGSNFIRFVLGIPDFDGRIVNCDKPTYAGNRLNLSAASFNLPPKAMWITAQNGPIRIIPKENIKRVKSPFHHRRSIPAFAHSVPI